MRLLNLADRRVRTLARFEPTQQLGLRARAVRISGIAWSSQGFLFGGRIVPLAGAEGQPGLVDGVGEAARFHSPTAITASADGRFALVVDSDNHAIRMIGSPGSAALTSSYELFVPMIIR
jgi:hypothetical protein